MSRTGKPQQRMGWASSSRSRGASDRFRFGVCPKTRPGSFKTLWPRHARATRRWFLFPYESLDQRSRLAQHSRSSRAEPRLYLTSPCTSLPGRCRGLSLCIGAMVALGLSRASPPCRKTFRPRSRPDCSLLGGESDTVAQRQRLANGAGSDRSLPERAFACLGVDAGRTERSWPSEKSPRTGSGFSPGW